MKPSSSINYRSNTLRSFLEAMRVKEIPPEWKVVFIEEVTKRGSGHTPNKAHPEYWDGGIKWVSLADSNKLDNRFIFETDKEISTEGIANSSAALHPPGVVILSRDAGVGKSAITGSEMAVSQHFIVWKCEPVLNNVFLYYWLQFFKVEFERVAIGSTIKTIGLPYFKKLEILSPPLPEQRKIAEILSIWDEAIAKTERLIAALRERKKGLMQRLLTGQVRFAGFNREWQEFPIGKLVKEVKRPVKWDDDAIYNLISVRRRSGGLFLREQRKGSEIKTKGMNVAFAGDFLISKMQIVHGASGLTTQEFDGMHISGSYISLVVRNPQLLDIRFFDLLSRTPDFYRLTYLSSYGVHIEKMTFNLEDFLKRTIRIPSLLDEQLKIIGVFSVVDENIRVLEQKLAALKEQKKGLMQRLLTGQVRVRM